MTPMPFAAPLARALLRSQSDERLVKLARDGQEGAFEEIVRRYRAPLVAFAAAYAPSERAEDVVQESLTNAWGALAGSDKEIALKPWLYTIVRNRALNARRDTRYHSELDETIDGVPRPDQIVLERDELQRAVAAVALLPEAQRKALVESAIDGRTHDQIAAELNTSPGSVRGLIHRGRVAVRGAVGAAVPLPLVAWAAGSGGAAAGTAAAGSAAAGGSLAAKGAAVASIAVLATGSGLVFERSLSDRDGSDRQARASERADGNGPNGDGEGPGDDRGGPGPPDNPGRTDDAGDDDDDDPGDDDDDHGRDDNSGPSRKANNSGPGSDNSGPGSDNSGPGSGGEDPDTAETPETPETPDNSGSGSDSSGSGSGSNSGSGSGSSGSGSGYIPPDDSDFDDPDTNTTTTGD